MANHVPCSYHSGQNNRWFSNSCHNFFVAYSHLKLLLKLAKTNHVRQLISCGLKIANVSRKKREVENGKGCALFYLSKHNSRRRRLSPHFLPPHSDYPLFLPPFRRRQTSRQADAGRTGRPPIWSQLARNATIDEEEGGGRTDGRGPRTRTDARTELSLSRNLTTVDDGATTAPDD